MDYFEQIGIIQLIGFPSADAENLSDLVYGIGQPRPAGGTGMDRSSCPLTTGCHGAACRWACPSGSNAESI